MAREEIAIPYSYSPGDTDGGALQLWEDPPSARLTVPVNQVIEPGPLSPIARVTLHHPMDRCSVWLDTVVSVETGLTAVEWELRTGISSGGSVVVGSVTKTADPSAADRSILQVSGVRGIVWWLYARSTGGTPLRVRVGTTLLFDRSSCCGDEEG